MPVTFEERERAFEAKFAHDEEMRFRAAARRDKLFAAWAAEQLHLPAEQRDALVKAIIAVWDAKDHDRAVVRHIGDFLAAHGAPAMERDLAVVLDRCAGQAKAELLVAPIEAE
jgi:hypothetical protein